MKIQIAGPGCARCHAVEQNVIEALTELGIDADVSKLSDPREFAKLGIFLTPAVIVDGKVVVSGKVPTVNELKKLISEAR
ncbi:MAG: TM0996/MTH895 family glutaredoxin-like protein [Deltaproteobacteria bacterium]|nr:TM0996/MTH895 family glutaredoxin-like protein [Deltaproteobacteria bacterium]